MVWVDNASHRDYSSRGNKIGLPVARLLLRLAWLGPDEHQQCDPTGSRRPLAARAGVTRRAPGLAIAATGRLGARMAREAPTESPRAPSRNRDQERPESTPARRACRGVGSHSVAPAAGILSGRFMLKKCPEAARIHTPSITLPVMLTRTHGHMGPHIPLECERISSLTVAGANPANGRSIQKRMVQGKQL
jgi:hypothetical protein